MFIVPLLISGLLYYIANKTIFRSKYPAPSPTNGAILITGASTGIGRESALFLAKKGFKVHNHTSKDKVFAGVRKEEDGRSIEQEFAETRGTTSGSLQSVIIDVKKNETIVKAREIVFQAIRAEKKQLVGLVNNA